MENINLHNCCVYDLTGLKFGGLIYIISINKHVEAERQISNTLANN